MLEVLISLVVIAFGMLGVAGLQAYALKNSQGASHRSVATVLATDLIDRMRANPVGATSNFYVKADGSEGASVQVGACTQAAGCTPEQLASHDLFEWHALIASSLPKGAGIVCRDSTPNDGQPPSGGSSTAAACDGAGSLIIKVWWVDDRSAKPNANAPLFHFWTAFQI